MIDVVTFKWNGNRRYTADHVNALYQMVRKHYRFPFRFSVVTDDAVGVDPAIRCIELWEDYACVASPFGERHPACYRRLKLFAPEAKQLIGERIICLDLDVIILNDIQTLWNRSEDVVFYQGQWGSLGTQHSRNPYNGSMFLLTAGSRPQVWENFNPEQTPKLTRAMGYGGSDQAWYAVALGHDEAIWSRKDGVYSFRNDIIPNANVLPKNARMVVFHGKWNPWDVSCQKIKWIKENYT